MTLDLAGRTDVGLKRSENQDEFLAELLCPGDEPAACLAVADGMGGHEKGRQASQAAIRTVQEKMESWLKSDRTPPADEWFAAIETDAHNSVRSLATGDEIVGATLTVAFIHGKQCRIAHVGDSRAYSFRNGKLQQVTEDQTWEAYALKNQTENNYGKALRQAIGVGVIVTPALHRLDLCLEDLILLCSDGLYKMVGDELIEAELRQSRGAKDACARLVNLALARGGKDNIAVCVARLGAPPAKTKKLDSALVTALAAAITICLLLLLALTGRI